MGTTAAPWDFCRYADLTPEAKKMALTETRKDHDDELTTEATDAEVIDLINRYEFLFYIDGYRC